MLLARTSAFTRSAETHTVKLIGVESCILARRNGYIDFVLYYTRCTQIWLREYSSRPPTASSRVLLDTVSEKAQARLHLL